MAVQKLFDEIRIACSINIFKQLDMDNNNTQMENWKKQIIMDPVLNCLFDQTITSENILIQKILVLPHDQIVNLYSKLATIKHSLSKSLQKEIQAKYQLIEKSFVTALEYRKEFDEKGNSKINEYITHLKKFNSKYEAVDQNLIYWKNICKVLHFAKALESFRVNASILKTLMRGYNGQQDAIDSYKIAKIIKQLTTLTNCHDFKGIESFENEQTFIASSKSVIHEIAKNKVIKMLGDSQLEQAQKQVKINYWIEVFLNLNTLKQFITSYFKSLLVELAEKVKETFKEHTIKDLNRKMLSKFVPHIVATTFNLIVLEAVFLQYRHLELFSNIPNLFTKFLEKLAEYVVQTVNWMRKQQQSKHNIKSRQQSLVWKYPTFYLHLSNVCDIIHQKLVSQRTTGSGDFLLIKEKIMISLLEVGRQYHQKCRECMAITFQGDFKEKEYCENFEQVLMESATPNILKTVIKYLCGAVRSYESNSQGNQEVANRIKSRIRHILEKQQLKPIVYLQYQQLWYLYEQQIRSSQEDLASK